MQCYSQRKSRNLQDPIPPTSLPHTRAMATARRQETRAQEFDEVAYAIDPKYPTPVALLQSANGMAARVWTILEFTSALLKYTY